MFFEQERSERKKRLPNTMRIYIYISSRNEDVSIERENEREDFLCSGGIAGRRDE